MNNSLKLPEVLVLFTLLVELFIPGSASAATTIISASWSSNKLLVQGSSTKSAKITLSNAVTTASLGTATANTSGGWSFSKTLSSSTVPCSIRATSSVTTDGSAVMNVTNRPASCVGKLTQSALTVTANPNPILVNGTTTLIASGGSGTGAVTFAATGTSGLTCNVTGTSLKATGTAGSCSVTATKAADPSYNAITSSAMTITVNKIDQAALTALATPTTVALGATSTLSTTGGSGSGAVSYTATGTAGLTCGISANILTATGVTGQCSVTATKSADATYNSTTSVPTTVTVGKANQATLSVTAEPMTIPVGASSSLTTAGGSGNGVVSYAATGSAGLTCAINGSTLTANNATGSCTVTAIKAEDNNYNMATSAAVSITVIKANQVTLTVVPLSSIIINGGRGTLLTAEGGSGQGAVTYTTTGSTGLTCTITNNTLFASGGTGACSVTAVKATDSLYNATISAPYSVKVENLPNVSINSTSVDSQASVITPVGEQAATTNTAYSVLAVNDLGMHCVDNDTRIVNILPPFQVMLGQVIQKAGKPILNPPGVQLYYSSASNPNDPIFAQNVFNGVKTDGTTFKTNFWDNVQNGGYDAFYPGFSLVKSDYSIKTLVPPDTGLLVPNAERYYMTDTGTVVPSGDNSRLVVSQQHAPGSSGPYAKNEPQLVNEQYKHKPFFVGFPFGYVADNVNWYEAPGIPLSPYDDHGRQNPYPLFKVQAKDAGGQVLASVDTTLPVSSESSCTNCHGALKDVDPAAPGSTRRSTAPIDTLTAEGLAVASSADDPQTTLLPPSVSKEYGADINILRLHDLKHGSKYVFPTPNKPDGENLPCNIKAGLSNNPSNSNGDDNCLANKAVVQHKPVVCQSCHYTPALDLLQVGPKSGIAGSDANGRNQLAHQTNSRVMHNHHGNLADPITKLPLFTTIPAPVQGTDGSGNGIVTNQDVRTKALEENCYQCHPGKETKCLRGAMFNGGVLCSDCHGDLKQVGNDFTREVSTTLKMPEALKNTLAKDFYTNPNTPRVPWGNEPGCGSCHTGDAKSNLTATSGALVNKVDSHGVMDNIRLRQAFLTGDAKATPIVPPNKKFAEPLVPDSINGFTNPGAGNPKLYRVSTGHGGVMCEGCHGPTHAEWPVATANANDNQTAKQLQGHAGTIGECSTCHTTSAMAANTQNGPHGMHLVDDYRFWKEAHKDMAKAENRRGGGTCAACHGADHLGTVLSRVPVTRTFSVESINRNVQAGKPVACNLCHSLEKSFAQ